MNIETEFSIGDKVYIDGCDQLTGVITAVQWRSEPHIVYEVSWIAGGDPKAPLIEEWRLTKAAR